MNYYQNCPRYYYCCNYLLITIGLYSGCEEMLVKFLYSNKSIILYTLSTTHRGLCLTHLRKYLWILVRVSRALASIVWASSTTSGWLAISEWNVNTYGWSFPRMVCGGASIQVPCIQRPNARELQRLVNLRKFTQVYLAMGIMSAIIYPGRITSDILREACYILSWKSWRQFW